MNAKKLLGIAILFAILGAVVFATSPVAAQSSVCFTLKTSVNGYVKVAGNEVATITLLPAGMEFPLRIAADGRYLVSFNGQDIALGQDTSIYGSVFNVGNCTQPGAPGSVDARVQRLLAADPVYRNQGAAAWARQLGFTYDSLTMEARQPEEETFTEANGDAMVVVSGIQVRVTNLKITQPACFTTDQKVTGKARFVKPDNFDPIRNPSVLYTDNEVGYSGTATLWGDCSNRANLMTAPLT